jgi:hypothetical protein
MKQYIYNAQDINRFNQKCSHVLANGCKIWKGAKDDRGYGKFTLGDSCISAHKFAYLAANGLYRTVKRVVHSCNNKDCVNPAHLSERSNKGRKQSIDLAHLKSLQAQGLSRKEVAAKLGCSYSSIKRLWH